MFYCKRCNIIKCGDGGVCEKCGGQLKQTDDSFKSVYLLKGYTEVLNKQYNFDDLRKRIREAEDIEQRKNEEQRRKEREAEETARRKAEEAERQRLEKQRRKEREAEETARRKAEEAERQKLEEQRRKEREAEETARRKAEEIERIRYQYENIHTDEFKHSGTIYAEFDFPDGEARPLDPQCRREQNGIEYKKCNNYMKQGFMNVHFSSLPWRLIIIIVLIISAIGFIYINRITIANIIYSLFEFMLTIAIMALIVFLIGLYIYNRLRRRR